MAKESYPLQQLATIKQKKLEEAEKELREKKKILEKEQSKFKELEAERDKVKEHKETKLEQLRNNLDEGAPAAKIIQMKQYLKIVDEKYKQKEAKVKEQLKVVETARTHVETAKQEVLKKHKEVEKLRLHKEAWQKDFRLAQIHEEELHTDEMGSVMHVHHKKEKNNKKQRKG